MTLLAGALAPLADWHHRGGPWCLLFPLFLIAAILFAVWMFRRGRWCGPGRPHRRQSAAEALEHRFARGEIDDDEYRRRRSVLDDSKEK